MWVAQRLMALTQASAHSLLPSPALPSQPREGPLSVLLSHGRLLGLSFSCGSAQVLSSLEHSQAELLQWPPARLGKGAKARVYLERLSARWQPPGRCWPRPTSVMKTEPWPGLLGSSGQDTGVY